jgi:hypothetical protein
VQTAYDLVFEKLPKKIKAGLETGHAPKPKKRR